jgi:hypothetical protein
MDTSERISLPNVKLERVPVMLNQELSYWKLEQRDMPAATIEVSHKNKKYVYKLQRVEE